MRAPGAPPAGALDHRFGSCSCAPPGSQDSLAAEPRRHRAGANEETHATGVPVHGAPPRLAGWQQRTPRTPPLTDTVMPPVLWGQTRHKVGDSPSRQIHGRVNHRGCISRPVSIAAVAAAELDACGTRRCRSGGTAAVVSRCGRSYRSAEEAEAAAGHRLPHGDEVQR
jgi:hypothetical protein